MKGSCLPCALLLAVLGYLGRIGGLVDGHGLARQGVDNPGPDNFIRHRYPSVVALENYLYIDGGELSQPTNGTGSNSTQSGQTYPSYAVSSTLSLKLSESWTNDTVEIRAINKTVPLLDQQIYWSDASINSFYTWGGMTVGSQPPPQNELWLFNADGRGGGAWSQVTQGDYRDFSQLKRPVASAFTQNKRVGYAFSGQVTSKTDLSVEDNDLGYAVQGLVSYDFQTGQWANDTTAEFGGYGTCLNGRAEHIPFGPNGLLLFLGGAETPTDVTQNSLVPLPWNQLNIYDPGTRKWYTQSTSGTKPPVVDRACSVGVHGPNNTYEIFIYGGDSNQLVGLSSDVHVLSLPGFVFFKADANSGGTPRADHACAVVGKGRRQMLSYGGVDGGPGLLNPTTTTDPWKQGLGIFDMSEMKWADLYTPDAADYESPAVVRDWYARGGMRSVMWDNDELKELFANGSSIMNIGTDNSTDGPAESSGSSSQRIGIIVGSTVGGVAAIAIAGAVALLLLRKRRRRRQIQPTETIDEYRPEPWPKDPPQIRSTTPGTIGTFLSDPTTSTTEPIELGTTTREELPAEDVGWTYELPVPTPRLRPELPDRKFT
ncbi:hypothetical protein GGR54DRAFT_639271 [Hypoxylon sp. NC1633]|nr:hypothetical protein GGR54DRAFT_639271 [Hypoxylon sp. NC1633]